jgi:hypothetical protein
MQGRAMATQTLKQQAVFPDMPRTNKVLDEDGNMLPDWILFFDNLILALQTNYKPEGIIVPSQAASNIALLTSTLSVANILYDSTNDQFKGNIAGTWKTFTLT